MNKMFNRLFGKNKKDRFTEQELLDGAKHREKIISRAEAMKRLSVNDDFKLYCEILREDKQRLIDNLLCEEANNMKSAEQKIRLVARINQIDKCVSKPKSLVWQMENLTEVREAIKEQSLVRQAHGKKTGGE